ncbi:hypothetical protein H074_03739 [Amycolatopsis decaplanina DSM 44594]|uniref:Uncharacterized protein n=1 Tax=Amycolatopsis decaplanina DSM 44594 TaxID=1284240 RepID=M2YP15_9PSEU|nr:hypothetical protein H074_03739 [Amycolatopsis decaplanina DSM 44594]
MGKLVLEEDFDVFESRVDQVAQQDGEALLPGDDLTRPSPGTEHVSGLLAQPLMKAACPSLD